MGTELCNSCPAVQYRRETDKKLNDIGTQYHQLNTEMALLNQALSHLGKDLAGWHKQHNDQMSSFDARLTAHMDEEPEEVALAIAPVIVRLDEMDKKIEANQKINSKNADILFGRWWAVSGALVLILLGVISYLYVETQSQNQIVTDIFTLLQGAGHGKAD